MKRSILVVIFAGIFLVMIQKGEALGYPTVCKIRARVISVERKINESPNVPSGDYSAPEEFQVPPAEWFLHVRILKMEYSPIEGASSSPANCEPFKAGTVTTFSISDWNNNLPQPVHAKQIFVGLAGGGGLGDITIVKASLLDLISYYLWYIIGGVSLLIVLAIFVIFRSRHRLTQRKLAN